MPIALAHLFQQCAPTVGTRTMSALVAYESGGSANAIGDNTAHRSYFPARRAEAQALAERLLRGGHDIDVGYAQINVSNFAAYNLTLADAFEPCTNVRTGASILRTAYAGAAHVYGAGQVALVHALSAYNTGGYWAGLAYARGVYAQARALRYEEAPAAPARGPGPRDGRRAFAFERTSAGTAVRPRFPGSP